MIQKKKVEFNAILGDTEQVNDAINTYTQAKRGKERKKKLLDKIQPNKMKQNKDVSNGKLVGKALW